MSGASRSHNIIAINFVSFLNAKLKGKASTPYSNDMRLHTLGTAFYTYPDILVVCGKEEFLDAEFDTLLNPIFIAEILSPSSADYDTGRKFMRYRVIPSLKEYWTISSFEYRIEKYLKNQSDNTWLLSEAIDITSQLTISNLDLAVSLKEIYEGVEI
jgi:Uma2 family endonuclease